jgi:hypothetical protein
MLMESIEESDSEPSSQSTHLKNMSTYLQERGQRRNNDDVSNEWIQLSGEDVVNSI